MHRVWSITLAHFVTACPVVVTQTIILCPHSEVKGPRMWPDIRDSVRSIRNRPGLATVVVTTLALAIGVNTTIFGALNAVLLQPLDYADPDRLVMLWESNDELGIGQEQVSAATYIDWRERSRALESIAAYRYRGFTLTEGPQPTRVSSVDVSPVLFDVLGVTPLLGRPLQASDERPATAKVAVISYTTWTRRFASDTGIVNQRILLDTEPYAVVGVMPESFRFPANDPSVEIWTPLTLSLESLPSRPHRMYDAVGKLADHSTLDGARREMSTIAAGIARENPESNAGWGVSILPVHEYITGNVRRSLWLLQGAVTLVLLIGCVNIANLLLAKSVAESGDYAVRAAFGATRAHLIRRSLLESLILATLGGTVGFVVSLVGVNMLKMVIPPDIPRTQEISIDAAVLTFVLAATALSGLVFGLVPTLRNVRPSLADSLHEGGRRVSPGRRTRWATNSLVLTEVALALILLVGAGLMLRSFNELTNVDPGFRRADVTSVLVSLPQSRYGGSNRQSQFFIELIERIRQRPGLENTGAVSALPLTALGTEFEMPFSRAGLDASSPSERPRADYRAVIPGYFEAMGIPLVQGRGFDMFEGEGQRVAIINESLRQRYFPDVNPIGQMLLQAPMIGDLEIIGVVGNVKHSSLAAESRPEMFVPFTQLPLSQMHVVTHTGDAGTAASAIRAEVLAMDPELPVAAVLNVADLLSDSVAQDRFNMLLLVGLATTAAALAALGIFGVVSYTVTRRSGEIGLRMALGASESRTLWLIVRQALSVVGAGVLIGGIASVFLGRYIGSMLYGVVPMDPATYGMVVLLLILVGGVAAAIPAARAARVDPVITLRGS